MIRSATRVHSGERGSTMYKTLFIKPHRLIDPIPSKGQVELAESYPIEYRGPRLIREQVNRLAALLRLPPNETLRFIDETLPRFTLPKLAEGWFAFPSVDAVAVRHFSGVKDPAERYCRAVRFMIDCLSRTRQVQNYLEDQLQPNQLHQVERTVRALGLIRQQQRGGILVVAAQFGLVHEFQAVEQVCQDYQPDEFGLGAFQVGCMAATHPERYVNATHLQTDCPGDRFCLNTENEPSCSPVWRFSGYEGTLGVRACNVKSRHPCYGSVTAFIHS